MGSAHGDDSNADPSIHTSIDDDWVWMHVRCEYTLEVQTWNIRSSGRLFRTRQRSVHARTTNNYSNGKYTDVLLCDHILITIKNGGLAALFRSNAVVVPVQLKESWTLIYNESRLSLERGVWLIEWLIELIPHSISQEPLFVQSLLLIQDVNDTMCIIQFYVLHTCAFRTNHRLILLLRDWNSITTMVNINFINRKYRKLNWNEKIPEKIILPENNNFCFTFFFVITTNFE